MHRSGVSRRETDFVMPGLDPGIHQSLNLSKTMDHRVKPGDDDHGLLRWRSQ
jgi:hypothetical protein